MQTCIVNALNVIKYRPITCTGVCAHRNIGILRSVITTLTLAVRPVVIMMAAEWQ